MKKSTKKIINHLKQYVGHEMIRTKPTHASWAYTDNPLLFVGFTSDGCIKCRYTAADASEFVLPLYYTDRNWITYKKALKSKGNKLNKWKGRKIKRIRPTSTYNDYSYMYRGRSDEAPTLVSASKHHVVIMCNSTILKGKTFVLRPDYSKPEDWVLAEDEE